MIFRNIGCSAKPPVLIWRVSERKRVFDPARRAQQLCLSAFALYHLRGARQRQTAEHD